MPDVTAFDKYEAMGAYHWIECDRRYLNWKRYNPALDARYQITIDAILSLRMRDSLLDIGCGDGLLMARIAPFMQRVVGVDSEQLAIRLAREKLQGFPNWELIFASSYDLPLGDSSIDVVVSADVIEHLKDPELHLREICRVVKPAGALVLTTPKWRQDRQWDIRHEKEYRADELRALLAEYFEAVALNFFWPVKASRFYETKLGWRLTKLFSIWVNNPFARSGTDPEEFGQILAVCRKPLSCG
jgi:2-polyprenyl-3-methyl-5-hydroxy-6-metoxy-1,4-benzoquinol methylase